MKLHLPLSLLAALALACPVHAAASSVTTNSTTISGDVANSVVSSGETYSGLIYTLSPKATYNSAEVTSVYNSNGQGYNIAGDANNKTYFTKFNADGTNGEVVWSRDTTSDLGSNVFWQHYCQGANGPHGNTLRLAANASDFTGTGAASASTIKVGGDFGPYTLGGLIVERTDVTWSVGRQTGSASVMRLEGKDAVNLTIGATTELRANSNTVEVLTGGTWKVDAGKTLTLTGSSTNIAANQTVNISRLSGNTDGTVAISGNLNLREGAAMNIASGMAVTVGTNHTHHITGAEGAVINLAGQLSGTLSTGTLEVQGGSLGTFTLDGGTIDLGTVALGAESAALLGTGNITLTSGNLTFGGADTLELGSYKLIGSGDTLTLGSGLVFNDEHVITNGSFFVFRNAGNDYFTATFTLENNILSLNVTEYAGQALTWSGGDGIWSTGGTGWGDETSTFRASDMVSFADNGDATNTITISEAVAPAEMTVDGNYIFNSSDAEGYGLSGTGTIVVNGSATINGTQSAWKGTTHVNNGGTLSVEADSSLLKYLVVAEGGEAVVNVATETTTSAISLSGAGTVTKNGDGVWRLYQGSYADAATSDGHSSNPNFTGDIVVNAGELQLGNSETVSSNRNTNQSVSGTVLGDGSTVTVNDGATLRLAITQAGSVALGSDVVLAGGTLVSHDGNYTIGRVELTADSTIQIRYQTTTINTIDAAGRHLQKTAENNVGGGTLAIGSGTIGTYSNTVGTTRLTNHDISISTLNVESGEVILTESEAYGNIGTVHVSDGATLTLNNVWTALSSNTIMLEGGGTIKATSRGHLGAAGGNITIDGSNGKNAVIRGALYGQEYTVWSNITGVGTVEFGNAETTHQNVFTIGGVISDGSGIVSVLQSSGNLRINKANTYSGTTTVSGGNMTVTTNGSLGTGDVAVSGTGSLTVNSGGKVGSGNVTLEAGTLNVAGANAEVTSLTQNGGTATIGSASGTVGTVTKSNGTLTVSGAGASITTLNNTGGDVTISGENASVDSVTKSSGTLTVSGTGASVTTINSTGGNVSITGENASVGTLTKSGGALTVNAAGVTITELTSNSGDVTFSNTDTTVGSLVTKGGITTLAAGDHQNMGDITVQNAVLRVAGNSTVKHHGNITVNNADGLTLATFKARTEGASYTNMYINYDDDFRPTTNTVTVDNADLEVSGTFVVRSATFTNSTVTVTSGGNLTSNNGTIRLNNLEILEGGRMGSGIFQMSGTVKVAVSLGGTVTTQTIDGTDYAVYTTDVVRGSLGENAQFTLTQFVLPETVGLAALGAAVPSQYIGITFSNISGLSSSNFMLDESLVNAGWSVNTDATTGNTVYLIKAGSEPVPGIPEPATATLSLLALAGLALRRRRK